MHYGAQFTQLCTKLAQRRAPVPQKQATATSSAMVLNAMLQLIGEWQPVPGLAVSLSCGHGREGMAGPNEALLSRASVIRHFFFHLGLIYYYRNDYGNFFRARICIDRAFGYRLSRFSLPID